MVIVTFNRLEQSRKWDASLQHPFPHWLDPQQAAYRAFGLKRSLAGTWHHKSLAFYADLLLHGRELPHGLMDDDLHQLGGDFVLDHLGRVRFAHYSQDSLDRPALSDILQHAAAEATPSSSTTATSSSSSTASAPVEEAGEEVVEAAAEK